MILAEEILFLIAAVVALYIAFVAIRARLLIQKKKSYVPKDTWDIEVPPLLNEPNNNNDPYFFSHTYSGTKVQDYD